jgi:hypothetical protein
MKRGWGTFGQVMLAAAILVLSAGPLAAEPEDTACTPGPIGAAGPWINGSVQSCSDFRVLLVDFGILGVLEYDSTDEGWVPVSLTHAGERYQSVSGRVHSSQPAYNDNTANHDSHDQGVDVIVDPQYLSLLSNVNGPNNEDTVDSVTQFCDPTSLELEWEIGTFPGEVGSAVPERTFPRWAWPNVGDRVWANGTWIFDCGHAKDVCLARDPQYGLCIAKQEYFHSEIHPPRAIAAMRNQSATLPSTGTTPVPVTATDLYIHGRAGMVGDVLACGMPVVLGQGSCATDPYPHRGFPINVNFEFDICLPARPTADARLEWSIANGPANSVTGLEPQVEPRGPLPECATNAGAAMDAAATLHVKVPLGGTSVAPDEVYARKIVAGWVEPPDPTLQHLNVALDRLNVHDARDGGLTCSEDGELTFFYASLDVAPVNEWIRVADYAPVFSNGHSVLNDYDDSLLGDALTELTNAKWDFYVRPGQPLGFRARGWEQDCYDDYFGDHELNVATPYIYCNVSPTVCFSGNNDELAKIDAFVTGPNYGGIDPTTGMVTLHPSSPPEPRLVIGHDPPVVLVPDYEFDMTVRRVPLALEDTSDLAITKSCVLDTGTSFLCTLKVSNPGPGLPKQVVVEDTLTASGGPGTFTLGAQTATRSDGSTFSANPCSITGPGHVSCAVGTVPVGQDVTIAFRVTSTALGDFDDVATVATTSTDPASANNQATAGWTVVPVDIKPGAFPNAINVNDSGSTPVAILKASGFDPVVVNPVSVCFGDAEDPPARLCSEYHGSFHFQDVDKDRDIDLLLHYETRRTGIDVGDTSACLSGTTFAGRTIVGCDSVKTK